MTFIEKSGSSSPLGATVAPNGCNFSLFSRSAAGVELLFFDRAEDAAPSRVIPLDPGAHRTYHYWHVFVPGARAGQLYGYRVQGPLDPARGMRFDATKVSLDPYGRGVVVSRNYSREIARQLGNAAAAAMKSVVVDPEAYDWEGDAPLQRPSARTVIYEMHVRGFTRHPSSGLCERLHGTYAGVIEKILPVSNVIASVRARARMSEVVGDQGLVDFATDSVSPSKSCLSRTRDQLVNRFANLGENLVNRLESAGMVLRTM